MKKLLGFMFLCVLLSLFSAPAQAQTQVTGQAESSSILPTPTLPPANWWTLQYYQCDPLSCATDVGPVTSGSTSTSAIGPCYNSFVIKVGASASAVNCDLPGAGLSTGVTELISSISIINPNTGLLVAYELDGLQATGQVADDSGNVINFGFERFWCNGSFSQNFPTAGVCPIPPAPPDPCCQCRMKGNEQFKGPHIQKTSLCSTCDCPIIIDTSGNGFDLTSAASGVQFDMSGTSSPVQIAWTAPGSGNAFLCLPDSSGRCDDGKDLFGNFTPQPATQTPNGYLALAVYDLPVNGGNGDGIIDSRDAIFSRLRLWIDRNHDGISQPDEIYTLPALGVYSISLSYKEDRRVDQYGNLFRYRSQINQTGPPGSVGRMMYDVFLLLGSGTITAQQSCPAPQSPRLLPEGKDVLK